MEVDGNTILGVRAYSPRSLPRPHYRGVGRDLQLAAAGAGGGVQQIGKLDAHRLISLGDDYGSEIMGGLGLRRFPRST